ncbi:hypothetical protein [Vibrio tritonius]
MSKLRQQLLDEMALRQFSAKTQSASGFAHVIYAFLPEISG